MSIKIYGDSGSGSLRRVTAAAAIMGIEIERMNIDLFKGESHTPEFLKLNPHGLSPVLCDGETVIWEASAINIYLASKANSDLLGKTESERIEVLQWMFWSGEQWRIFATTLFNQWAGELFMGQSKSSDIVELANANIRAAAKVLDQRLARQDFIVGNSLTLADIDIAAPFSQSSRTGAPFHEFPNLVAWQQRLVETLPAWDATRREVDERMKTAIRAVA